VLESTQLLAEGAGSFNDRCAAGIAPNEKRIREPLDGSLMLVTALNTSTEWCCPPTSTNMRMMIP
jgi:fumarate hydratase, class II